MTEIDLSRLPTGSMGWRTLVNWAAESDDRIERFFLELKSDVDLSKKSGRHKVAKFILGSAHRDPARAAKRFGGHAIMLIGVSPDSVVGISPFEAKDLAREVAKFTGADGPIWDYELVPVDPDHDVVAVIVDPPSGQVWPCLSDGDGLVDGDVYIRGDGETSKAKGSEVRSILGRAIARSGLPSVAVELIGSPSAIRIDEKVLLQWIEARAAELEQQGRPATNLGGVQILTPSSMDRRSRAEFLEQVRVWRSAAVVDPRDGVRDIVAAYAPPVRVRIFNDTKQFLRDVRVDIEVDGDVEALEWLEEADAGAFPKAPKDFGKESITSILSSPQFHVKTRFDSDRRAVILQSSPARISISMDILRPEEDFLTDENELVLARFVKTADPAPVMGRWRLTAGDIHDVRSGEFELATEYRDWADALSKLLSLDD